VACGKERRIRRPVIAQRTYSLWMTMAREVVATQDLAQFDEVSPVQAEKLTRICAGVRESRPLTIRLLAEVRSEVVPA